MVAADIMTRDVVTLSARDTVKQAMEALIENRVSGAPVVGSDGELVGLITEQDLMMVLHTFMADWKHLLLEDCQILGAALQKERLVTAEPDTPLEQISVLLIQKRIKRIPVLANGRVVGIVSRRDILRWLLDR